MPIEIKELQINVTVNQQSTNTSSPSSRVGAKPSDEEENKKIINQCVEQVMEILNNRKER